MASGRESVKGIPFKSLLLYCSYFDSDIFRVLTVIFPLVIY